MLRTAIIFALVAFGCGDPTNSQSSGWLASAAPARAASDSTGGDPLPSWNDGATKRALVDFVDRATREGGSDFVPLEARIAVFDNDGTLWTEQPFPPEVAFALDRMKQTSLAGAGSAGLLASAEAGMSTDAFARLVGDWIATATHPRFKRHYTELVYQPMLELLAYLRARGFKTYLVSGDETDFMRVWAERTYGIVPEQVIGTRLTLRYEEGSDGPILVRQPRVELMDDKAGKAVGIEEMIGRRPIVAFGNSDGDLAMLEWTTSAPRFRLGVLVHHTDAIREYAYDRDALVGRLARGLDEAAQHHWLVIDMKRDWNVVFPFERR
ncbi:MAG TPA: HAD family hydrolase [Kofleriaceae bacterium]|jgi:phosphoserine phosphatase